MFGFLSPIDALSSIALLVLAVFGSIEFILTLKNRRYVRKKRLSVLKVDSKITGGKVNDFIQSIQPPFTFEVAVHHLGKDVHYYLVVPSRRAKEFTGREGIEEVEDYHLFHHGGEHLGVYFKGDGVWPDIDLEKVDFSKVDEVGEGVAIQMIVGRRKGNKIPVNFRILISAPSSYQAKEILATIKPAFAGFNFIESRGEEFIHRVNFREFNQNEAIHWSLARPAKSQGA